MADTTALVPASGMVVLPKLRMDGLVKITAIDPNAITGVEDTTLMYKGVKHKGTKIYTATGFFKVFAQSTQVLLGQHQAKQGQLVAVACSVALPSYQKEVLMLKAGEKTK